MPVYALGEEEPDIHDSAYVHPDAVVIGRVMIGAEASVWPCAVLRGDAGPIEIGARTSVQDGTVVHATRELATVIGPECVVGHNAHLEGCVVGSQCLIGSGAVVLNRASVGDGSLVAASGLVPEGFAVPPRTMAMGVPVRLREMSSAEGRIGKAVRNYAESARRYRTELRRLDSPAGRR